MQAALSAIALSLLEDLSPAEQVGQVTLPVFWAIIAFLCRCGTGPLGAEVFAVLASGIMCLATPQLSLLPHSSSLMVVLENRGSGRDDVQIEEVLGASLVPSCLLLSCALLPVRLSRFRYVAGSAIASCVAAAIAFRSWYDGWQCLVVLCAAVIAQVIVHQREVILRRCFELTIQRDEKPVQVASHTLEKGEDVRCQETALARASALERLTRHLCDAFIELTDRYTLEQSPYLQAFFMQEMEAVPLVSLLPAAQQKRFRSLFSEVSLGDKVLQETFTLPRGQAEFFAARSSDPDQHYVVAINLLDTTAKLHLMKDLSLSEDVLTQDSGSGSLQIPQDRPDVTNRSSVRSKDAEASSLRRDSAKDYLQAARQLAYTGSQRSQTSQRSQRSSQPSKRSWSSSQSLDEAGKDSGRRLRTTARKEKKDKRSSKARDSPGSGRDSHFLSLADASEGRPGISELALRGLDSVLRRPGDSSPSLVFSHSLLSLSLQTDESFHRRARCEKEIQVDLDVTTKSTSTQNVQTEFTVIEDDFHCYHCMYSRPPLERSRSQSTTSSSSGSLAGDPAFLIRGAQGRNLAQKRRRSSVINLRRATEEMLSRVWSGAHKQHDVMNPDFLDTGAKNVVRSLALLLRQWNLEYPANVCCKYHAAVSLVIFLLNGELRAKCKNEWMPNSGWQCDHCNMLFPEDVELCAFCATDDIEQEAEELPPEFLEHLADLAGIRPQTAPQSL